MAMSINIKKFNVSMFYIKNGIKKKGTFGSDLIRIDGGSGRNRTSDTWIFNPIFHKLYFDIPNKEPLIKGF